MTAQAKGQRTTPRSWDELLSALLEWADGTDAVRGVIMVGSRARTDRPADQWSDLDLILVCDDQGLIDDEGWLDQVASVWVSLVHPGPLEDAPVRQVVFAGGYDVDVVMLGPSAVNDFDRNPALADLLGRGMKVLLDKDGVLDQLELHSPDTLSNPTPDEFAWAISDLLFQFVWATKHLLRGDVWQAKDDVDCYMRNRLLSLIEWHTTLNGGQTAAWAGSRSAGRGIESWADPRVLGALPDTFAAYDNRSVAFALTSLAGLVEWLGSEIAEQLGSPYPIERHVEIVNWMTHQLDGLLNINDKWSSQK